MRRSKASFAGFLDGVASFAVVLGSAASGLIAVGVTVSVLLRETTGLGIPGVNETSVLLLVIAAFLGFIEAERSEAHVRATILTSRTSPLTTKILRVIAMLVLAGISSLMTYSAALRALASYRGDEFLFGIVRYPVWPTRAAIALGLGFLALYSLNKAYRIARAAPDGNPLMDANKSSPVDPSDPPSMT